MDQNGLQILMLPFFAYFAIQFYNDIILGYDTWSFRFASHYDPKNLGYVLGKVGDSLVMFMSFFDFISSVQVGPKTNALDYIKHYL